LRSSNNVSLVDLLYALLILLGGYYCAVILSLLIGLQRIRFKKSDDWPLVSVIVAARNEEATVGPLLENLLHQTYPEYEVIVVNDRSTDRTKEIVGSFQQSHPNLRRIDIESTSTHMPAKKNALANGIAASKGEILCFTDADCLPPPGWIAGLVSAFDEGVGLVAGFSPYDASLLKNQPKTAPSLKRLLYRFIEYEEFKGAVWSAGAIGLQKGWLCTGRSLAYRRSVYDQVGGFEKIKHSVSGDDDLFLQLVRRETSWKIRYVTDAQSFVPTPPPATIGAFIRQRTRHFSAGKYFPPSMKTFFFLFHAANLALLAGAVAYLLFGGPTLPLLLFGAKLIVDLLLFSFAAPIFHQLRLGTFFLFGEILYVLYNTLIGPLGFLKPFEWKPEPQA
jgi:biofilm PGA synthesis N-glycosyltransferase PgaC